MPNIQKCGKDVFVSGKGNSIECPLISFWSTQPMGNLHYNNEKYFFFFLLTLELYFLTDGETYYIATRSKPKRSVKKIPTKNRDINCSKDKE